MIQCLNHVGISVANLERALAFYRDLLGLEVLVHRPFAGRHYEMILGLEGASGRVAFLKSRLGGLQIELFEFERPTAKPGDPHRPVCDHGITHFCLEVKGIEGEYERLKTAGVVFHCPPLEYAGQVKVTYGRDPDGNVFELLEMTAGS
jgi:catechol 2,3-dioxygenase-like lactoylglutathione lyase family enzyme